MSARGICFYLPVLQDAANASLSNLLRLLGFHACHSALLHHLETLDEQKREAWSSYCDESWYLVSRSSTRSLDVR
jgi:hypothetical protein